MLKNALKGASLLNSFSENHNRFTEIRHKIIADTIDVGTLEAAALGAKAGYKLAPGNGYFKAAGAFAGALTSGRAAYEAKKHLEEMEKDEELKQANTKTTEFKKMKAKNKE